MLNFFDRVLTACIDWLYLKRTVVRLKLEAKESEDATQYTYPDFPEVIDRRLQEFGLSVAVLSKTTSQCYASNIDAEFTSH